MQLNPTSSCLQHNLCGSACTKHVPASRRAAARRCCCRCCFLYSHSHVFKLLVLLCKRPACTAIQQD